MSSQTSTAQSAACSARTARGLRTPTGDYMTCAGGHAPGDQHGAGFGKAGWFSWPDDSDSDTAPLPAPAADALSRLELKVAALRYRDASESCSAASTAGDIDGCLAAQDEMRHCLCQLEAAGRLDLIGVSR
ncbi:hypothetical protein M2164_005907 [Streptomyces sp. SAI-208]|uniref:hypothetical protein n=1 Tax=Streptomyces sp. SAI-208 TaxID=2940550 RepID=UPI0024745F4D|nr:hypothetical protein [Streptomyces sp. SAI-208]MDH6610272.1 hypothetical protein [Streptomyces sp. SAI-208]